MTRRNNPGFSGEKIGLKLSTEERQLLLDLTSAEKGILHASGELRPTRQAFNWFQPIDSLAGSVAADANHTSDKTRRRNWSEFTTRRLPGEPHQRRVSDGAGSDPIARCALLDPVPPIAEAESLGDSITNQHVELMLTKAERAVVLNLPTLKDSLRRKPDGRAGIGLSNSR
jgi:hypothetical protein